MKTSIDTKVRSAARPLALGLALFAAAGSVAAAQDDNGYGRFDPTYNTYNHWMPGWDKGNYDRHHVLLGTVADFKPYRLLLSSNDGGQTTQVDLKNGTVIRPEGTTLTSGMRVAVMGYWSKGTFIANRVILRDWTGKLRADPHLTNQNGPGRQDVWRPDFRFCKDRAAKRLHAGIGLSSRFKGPIDQFRVTLPREPDANTQLAKGDITMDFPRQLNPGEGLATDDTVTSSNRAFQLVMQRDGNLVAYQVDARGERTVPTWASNTVGNVGARARMQGDGNLVIYGADDATPIWASNTAGRPGAVLRLGDDGTLGLYVGEEIAWTARGGGLSGVTSEIGGAAESALGALKENISKLTKKPK
jgi:hypothetical protein